jgi:hypothetical protein
LSDNFEVRSQTGVEVKAERCLVDEAGRVYLITANGLGLVHSLDVGRLANALDLGLWTLQDCVSSELPKLYGYVTSPQVDRLAQQQT